MKKYLQEWWTVYAVGISSGLITLKKPIMGGFIYLSLLF